MNAVLGTVFPAIEISIAGIGLTAACLWLAGRMAPWFLNKAVQPPKLHTYFTDLWADVHMTRERAVTGLIALALVLFAVLSLALVTRLTGWAPGA